MFASKTSFPLTKELTIIRLDGQTDTLKSTTGRMTNGQKYLHEKGGMWS